MQPQTSEPDRDRAADQSIGAVPRARQIADQEAQLDATLDQSFPASDPASSLRTA